MTAYQLLSQWLRLCQITPECGYEVRIGINKGRTYVMDWYMVQNSLVEPFVLLQTKHIKDGKVLKSPLEGSESDNNPTLFD